MIDQLDKVLRLLLTESGAVAAVIWVKRRNPTEATVLTSCPAGLIMPGTPWPAADDGPGEAVQRSPAELAVAVPASLRLRLDPAPVAAQTFHLGGGSIFLLVVWDERSTEQGVVGPSRRLIDDEVSYLARSVEDSRFNHGESERLLAVIDGLDEGVVSVSPYLGQANVNGAAAKILDLDPGQVPASDFASAMAALSNRAINRQEIVEWSQALALREDAAVEGVMRFTARPTHLKVRSLPVRRGAFAGRIWVFTDESVLSEALEQSEHSRALMRAASDALLDPQVLLEPRRDASGHITDFVYREINRATSDYLGLAPEEVLGRGLTETMPGLTTMLPGCIRCLETGDPLVLNDFAYINEIYNAAWCYDIRATRSTSNSIVLTWRDVTERFRAAQDRAKSRDLMRASMDAMLDPQVLLEAIRDGDGRVVDFHYISANRATLLYLQVSEAELLGRRALDTLPNLEGSGLLASMADCLHTGEPVILSDFAYFNEMLDAMRRYDIRASRAGPDLLSFSWIDVTERYVAARALAASAERYRLLTQNSSDAITHVRDGRFVWVSPAIETVLGAPPEHWIGREVHEIIPPEDIAELGERLAMLAEGRTVQRRVRVIDADGAEHWVHVHASPFFDSQGRRDGFTGSIRVVDDEVAAEREVEQAQRDRARSDELLRRATDNAAIGMCLISPEGGFIEVNDALCRFFGYDAENLKKKTWQELTGPDHLEVDLSRADDVLAGRLDSYRMLKQYIHADGHLIWGDLSVSCLRDDSGQVEQFISQVTDVTAMVEANQLNIALNHRITEELRSAASYVASLMPTGLTGTVDVTSRYLPCGELGGDCFDYTWIDDDHLIVYLIDVSGHGIEPALLSVSLQNILRSGTLSVETLLDPAAVLTELNRMFQMEQQSDHYFTMWYAVYEPASRTLRYASAGAPPAFAFDPVNQENDVTTTELATAAPPIGVFGASDFSAGSYSVTPGCRILIYSDGASEVPLAGGGLLSMDGFTTLATRLAESRGWSLDDLVDQLRDLTGDGGFVDDLSLIQLAFD
jgi:PAS domain S-box-containing protein